MERAEESQRRAQEILKNKAATTTEVRMAEARLKRALVRKGVANLK